MHPIGEDKVVYFSTINHPKGTYCWLLIVHQSVLIKNEVPFLKLLLQNEESGDITAMHRRQLILIVSNLALHKMTTLRQQIGGKGLSIVLYLLNPATLCQKNSDEWPDVV